MEFVDYLVVGQGLAGSLLTLLLQERGRSVIVVDNDHRHAASRAAGGIINPPPGFFWLTPGTRPRQDPAEKARGSRESRGAGEFP